MQQRTIAVNDAVGAIHVPRSTVLGAVSDAMGTARPLPLPERTGVRWPPPEERTNPLVLPVLLGVSLGIHVVLVWLAAFLPQPAEAAATSPSEMELNFEVQPAPEIEALPEPTPEPEVVPEPTPVVSRRRVARPEPAPTPAEPPPPALVMVAEGIGASAEWAHHPGEEGGQLGGTPGGTGTGEAAPAPVASEAVAPRRRGLSRRELRRRVLAYIRGPLSSFVNGRLDYPLEARRNHLEGVVVLRLRLGVDGELVSVRLSRSSGHELLDRAALARVQGLRSMPAPPDSIPWDAGLEIPLPVTYRLH